MSDRRLRERKLRLVRVTPAINYIEPAVFATRLRFDVNGWDSIKDYSVGIVRGVGSYLPRRVVTNRDLEKLVETSHEWILQRTGIEARHIAGDDETTSVIGVRAAQAALDAAGSFRGNPLTRRRVGPAGEGAKAWDETDSGSFSWPRLVPQS